MMTYLCPICGTSIRYSKNPSCHLLGLRADDVNLRMRRDTQVSILMGKAGLSVNMLTLTVSN